MRSKLVDICTTADNLAMGLSENGLQHRRYKMYTSMERALEILRSGNMYFSTGRNWNDLQDRQLMSRGRQYGGCYSWSTVENIAMWMLYGAECGKNGAMLDFPQSIMAELVSSEYPLPAGTKKTLHVLTRTELSLISIPTSQTPRSWCGRESSSRSQRIDPADTLRRDPSIPQS